MHTKASLIREKEIISGKKIAVNLEMPRNKYQFWSKDEIMAVTNDVVVERCSSLLQVEARFNKRL